MPRPPPLHRPEQPRATPSSFEPRWRTRALRTELGLQRDRHRRRLGEVMLLGAGHLHVQITPRANPALASPLLPHRVPAGRTAPLPDGAVEIGQSLRAERASLGVADRPSRVGLDACHRTLGNAQAAVITGIGVDGKDSEEAVRLRQGAGGTGVLATTTTNAHIGNHSETHGRSFLGINAMADSAIRTWGAVALDGCDHPGGAVHRVELG